MAQAYSAIPSRPDAARRTARGAAVGEDAEVWRPPAPLQLPEAPRDVAGPPVLAELRLQRPFVPVLATIVLILALVAGTTILYYLFYAITALLIVTFFWTRSLLQNITVHRVLRTKWCVVGDTIQEDFYVSNEGRLPALWVEVRDESTIPSYSPGVVESLGPGEERRWVARAVCRRRGLYTLGPLRVLTGDPFGLFLGTISYYQISHFIVYPPILEVPGLPLPWGTAAGSSRSSMRTHHVTTDAAGIRDFAPGDSLSRIHWLSTARRGELQAKEYDLEPSGNLWIILDLDAAVHAGEDEESTEEYAVKLACALTHRAIRESKAVGVVAFGREKVMLRPAKGAHQLWRMMELLATAAADGMLPLSEVMREASTSLGRGLSVVVITPSLDTGWLNALSTLRHRVSAPTVILLDRATFETTPTDSAHDLGDRLSAAGLVTYVVKKGQQFRAISAEKRDVEEQRRLGPDPFRSPWWSLVTQRG